MLSRRIAMTRAALALLLSCYAALAAEPEIALVALDGPVASGVPHFIERFTETPTAVSCAFLVGEKTTPEIVAEVFLDGGVLAAPLLKALPFVPKQDTAKSKSILEGSLSLPLTELKKSVRLLVVLKARVTPTDPWERCGTFGIHLVPKDGLRKALAAATAKTDSSSSRLRVFGAVPGLREMLRVWKVPFRDLGAAVPTSADAGDILIGDLSSNSPSFAGPPSFDHASLFLHLDDVNAAPGLLQASEGDTQRTIFNSPIHADWRESAALHSRLTAHLQKTNHPP